MAQGGFAPLYSLSGGLLDKTFSECYSAVFERVCVFLGNGWRIDRRTEDKYRLILINPDYRHYSISARLENGRIILLGSVNQCRRSNTYSRCTVSPHRGAPEIARDIERKLLSDARSQIAIFEADSAGAANQREDRRNLLHLLGRLTSVYEYDRGTNVLCSITTKYGIKGDVTDRYGGYQLNLNQLSKDQLIKVVGILSTLER